MWVAVGDLPADVVVASILVAGAVVLVAAVEASARAFAGGGDDGSASCWVGFHLNIVHPAPLASRLDATEHVFSRFIFFLSSCPRQHGV